MPKKTARVSGCYGNSNTKVNTFVSGMKNNFLFKLNDEWALGYDSLQWMLMRSRTRAGKQDWDAVSYITCAKATLRSVMRDKECIPDEAGQALLDQLPETFRVWYAQHIEAHDE